MVEEAQSDDLSQMPLLRRWVSHLHVSGERFGSLDNNAVVFIAIIVLDRGSGGATENLTRQKGLPHGAPIATRTPVPIQVAGRCNSFSNLHFSFFVKAVFPVMQYYLTCLRSSSRPSESAKAVFTITQLTTIESQHKLTAKVGSPAASKEQRMKYSDYSAVRSNPYRPLITMLLKV